MEFLHKNIMYPRLVASAEDEVFQTIAPDINGDFFLLEFHASDGVKILDSIAKAEVTALISFNKEG